MSPKNRRRQTTRKLVILLVQLILSVFFALLLLVYSFGLIKFDGFSIILIAIVGFIWINPKTLTHVLDRISTVELFGNKITLADLKQKQNELEKAGLLDQPSVGIPAYQQIASTDPNLALAGLRIEIEKKLREIAEERGLLSENQYRYASLTELIYRLTSDGILTNSEQHALKDLIGTLNQAVHGAQVNKDVADWALDIGPRLISSLDQR